MLLILIAITLFGALLTYYGTKNEFTALGVAQGVGILTLVVVISVGWLIMGMAMPTHYDTTAYTQFQHTKTPTAVMVVVNGEIFTSKDMAYSVGVDTVKVMYLNVGRSLYGLETGRTLDFEPKK